MTKVIPLDEQIVAVLTADATSDEAAAVLADAERVLTDLTGQADKSDVASLNPLATAVQARKHRDAAADARFEADRMEASVSALRARLAEITDAERDARRRAERASVLARRDTLAKEIADQYPGIVVTLTEMAKRIAESDAECRGFGIESAESVGRGVPANFYLNGGPVMRLADARVPMPTTARCAWEASIEGIHWNGLHASDDARL